MSAYLGSTPINVLNVLFRNKEAVALYRGSTFLQTFGSSEFSPLDLFAWGKQGVWYDPSDKSTLFQDVAGTVPVTKDGDPVALIRDKSGNGNHALQSKSTSRPVYKTDGILHWLAFDGVDDYLSIPRFTVLTQPYFYSTSIKRLSNAISAYLYDARNLSGNNTYIIQRSNETNISVGEPQVKGEYLPSINELGTFSYLANGSNSKVKTNKTSKNIVLGNVGFEGGILGARSNGNESFKHNLYGLIIASGLGIDSAENYLSNKSGVTL